MTKPPCTGGGTILLSILVQFLYAILNSSSYITGQKGFTNLILFAIRFQFNKFSPTKIKPVKTGWKKNFFARYWSVVHFYWRQIWIEEENAWSAEKRLAHNGVFPVKKIQAPTTMPGDNLTIWQSEMPADAKQSFFQNCFGVKKKRTGCSHIFSVANLGENFTDPIHVQALLAENGNSSLNSLMISFPSKSKVCCLVCRLFL